MKQNRFLAGIKSVFNAKGVLAKTLVFMRFVRLAAAKNDTLGDILGVPKDVRKAWAQMVPGQAYDPDQEFDALKKPVLNQAFALCEAAQNAGVKDAKWTEGNPFKASGAEVEEAWLYEAHADAQGRILRAGKALESRWGYGHRESRVVRVGGDGFKAKLKAAEANFEALAKGTSASQVISEARLAAQSILIREGFMDAFAGGQSGSYDPNQYGEFAPIMGGPFSKQLYLHDYLSMHAYAYEAWNHHPLAKRIVKIITQYTFGRRFTLRFDGKKPKQEKAWKDFDKKFKVEKKIARFWSDESLIYGEIMLDKEKMKSVDPSTVWDIVTDPDNIEDVYYYFQSYPTQYQMFTGYQVKGEPGAAKQPSQKYIVRQIPASQIIHMKFNCVSNEKRGRSLLFPILGWLKRVKDLYNAQVISEWLQSMFTWDVTIKGDGADVAAYAAKWNVIPTPGTSHVHNENVERKAMGAGNTGGSGSRGADIAENLLAFIATAVGIPKEFLNISSRGGGSRAQALTTAEPFTKVIEDMQASWEEFIKEIIAYAMDQAGVDYEEGDVEVLFPSVTKDTTTETIANLAQCETMGWFSKRTAAEMAAKEMNYTEFDFDDEQAQISDDEEKGLNKNGSTPMPPAGRFGKPGLPTDGTDSEIHGQGKQDLVGDLKSL